MCHKPNRAEGQAKLQQWAEERGQRNGQSKRPTQGTHPRGNQDPDRRDLERSVERFEALLGR